MTKNSSDKIINTNGEKSATNGQYKCPKCGATDISMNSKTGKLKCNFCRHVFDAEKVENVVSDIKNLKGKIIGKGAQNISKNAKDVLTLKCQSCGAEVVMDTKDTLHKRCHWCRNTLSINDQIENGAVPDMILPFKLEKYLAQNNIEHFVKKRRFYAHPTFLREFTTENILGVYLPYLVIDLNAKANFQGKGEITTRTYYVGSGEDKEKVYDFDSYSISRKFDIAIHDLTIESSGDKLDYKSGDSTTNIINSIMPFDTENCVKWNANYLKGYTSEKRNVNVDGIHKLVKAQGTDVAKHAVNDTLKAYNRGVKWSAQGFDIEGEQWVSAYLPVWLYSYQQKIGDNSLLHYVAVNARTNETMGSVPINKVKLFIISLLIELLTIPFIFFVFDDEIKYILLSAGFIYYFIIYRRYRNNDKRHTYELETKNEITNLVSDDKFLSTHKGSSRSTMAGANNKSVNTKSYKEFLKEEENSE